MEKTTLPTVITATRTVSYRVDSIVTDLLDMETEPTLETVLDYIKDWANEDLASSRVGIIYQDQDGNSL